MTKKNKKITSKSNLKTQNKWINILLSILLFVITIVSMYFTIIYGIEADEQYNIALIKKFEQGKLLFKDFYEPHQLSVILSYWLYIISGKTVIGLNAIGCMIQIAIGCLCFYRFKDRLDILNNTATSLFIIAFTPKFSYMPDYALLQYWCFTLIIIFTLTKKDKLIEYIVLGVLTALMIIAYPTYILIVPFILYNLNKKNYINYALGISVGIIVSIILSKFQFSLKYILNILSDSTHNISLLNKLKGQWATSKIQIISISIILILLIFTNNIKEKTKNTITNIIICLTLGISAYETIINKQVISFESKWIILISLLTWQDTYRNIKNNKKILVLPMISMLISFLSSNQGLLFFLRYGVALLIILVYLLKDKKTIICALIMCNLTGCFISTNNFYSTILPNNCKQYNSVLKHISIDAITNTKIKEFTEYYRDKHGTICLISNNNILYSYSDLEINCPNTISTPNYNETYIEYWESTSLPDYIYYDKNLNIGYVNIRLMNFLNEKFECEYETPQAYYLKKK